MSNIEKQRILSAIDEYIHLSKEELLDDILQTFQSEYDDAKAIAALEQTISYFRVKSPSSTPENSKPKIPSNKQENCHVSTEKHIDDQTTVTVENKCNSIMSSGIRKGQICGGKVYINGMCKRHQPKTSLSEEKCPAIMKAGTRKGQICGARVANCETFCGKHKVTKCVFNINGENCEKNVSVHSPSETHCRIHIKNELNLDTKKFITTVNRFGNMEHKYSGLVFENKKIVGAQHPAGTIVSNLSDDDLECAIVYGLPLDEMFHDQMKDYLNRRKQKQNGSPSSTRRDLQNDSLEESFARIL